MSGFREIFSITTMSQEVETNLFISNKSLIVNKSVIVFFVPGVSCDRQCVMLSLGHIFGIMNRGRS